jgi:DNA end-binding protein Ku
VGARAIWKAVIRLDDGVDVPVKLYSAVEDRSVHFRLLHEEDLVPVKQRMVNPDTGDAVEYSESLRAYETDTGSLVVLGPEELEALEPEPTRDVEVTRFVEPSDIDHPWYDRPYYLGPDGSTERYFALAEALRQSGRVGIARWVMRNKEYRGALRPEGRHLMLVTLHAEQEMVPVSALEAPGGRKLEKNELEMAEQLIDALGEEFDPRAYENEHRSRVMELIEAKEAGEVVDFRQPEAREEAGADLSAALEASLESATEKKSA